MKINPQYELFKIISITDKDGNARHTPKDKEGQLYDDWSGMIVRSYNGFKVGYVAWLEYVLDNKGYLLDGGSMHTSIVEEIEEVDNRVILYTMNSIYTLECVDILKEE